MKKTLLIIASAAGLSLSSLVPAVAQNAVMDTISCSAQCNSDYAQCMGDGVRFSQGPTLSEANERTRTNFSNARMCRKEITQCKRACYSRG